MSKKKNVIVECTEKFVNDDMMICDEAREKDKQDLIYLRQMIIEAEKQYNFNQILSKEYQYILSKVIDKLDYLEAKYGI